MFELGGHWRLPWTPPAPLTPNRATHILHSKSDGLALWLSNFAVEIKYVETCKLSSSRSRLVWLLNDPTMESKRAAW